MATTRRLAFLAGALLALTVVHDFDHVRQGRSLQPSLYLIAALGLGTPALVVALAARNDPRAGPGGLVVGLGTVGSVATVHVLPARRLLSDSYGAAGADALSWAIILAMMAVGGLLAVLGAGLRRRPGAD